MSLSISFSVSPLSIYTLLSLCLHNMQTTIGTYDSNTRSQSDAKALNHRVEHTHYVEDKQEQEDRPNARSAVPAVDQVRPRAPLR